MAESATDLDPECERVGSSNCPANWDPTSTLVFRQVGGDGAVTVSPNFLTVDITAHNDASLHSHEQVETEREVFSLSWSCEAATTSCQSTLTIHVKEPVNNIHGVVLNTLSKDGFMQLRQFANMMFKEYNTRITSVFSPPVRFVCFHGDKAAMENFASNVHELERKFKIYILNRCEVAFELKIHSDKLPNTETLPEGKTLRSLMSLERGAGISMSAQGDINLNFGELEKLEAQFRTQAEHIETDYREQKRRNYVMRSTLRSVLERESEAFANLPVTSRRDPGDGADKQTSNSTTALALAKLTNGIETSSPDTNWPTSTPDNQHMISPQSNQETRSRIPSSNPYSQSRPLPNSKPDNGNRSVSSDSISQHNKAKPSAQENRPASAKQQATSGKEQRESKTADSKPSQVHNRKTSKSTGVPQHPSTTVERRKSDHHRKDNHDSLEGEESPPRANGMDAFLCFHTTDKQEPDEDTKQQMKDAALKYMQCLEDIAKEHDVQENIALVAKDNNSWIKQKPTNDFSQVRTNIENLSLGYPTSLVDVLETAMEFVLSAGHELQLGHGYAIRARVVIVSNHMTFCSAHGLFIPYPIDKEEFHQTKETVDKFYENCGELTSLVMVGGADRRFLSELESMSMLKCYEAVDIDKMAQYQLSKVAAGRMISYFLEQGTSLSGNVRADTDTLVEVFGSHLDYDSQQSVRKGIRRFMLGRGHGSDTKRSDNETSRDLPPLGSRVVRGEDWVWNNQDSEGPGTVIEHRPGGNLLIEWDNGYRDHYRYGDDCAYDVKVVHDRPKQNTSNSSIDIGCEVVRGPDWSASTDEDGGEGGVGVVITGLIFGELSVRWYENDEIKTYLFGRDGKYEVMLRDTTESTTAKIKDDRDKESAEKLSKEAIVTSQENSQAPVQEKTVDSSQKKPPEEGFVWQWQDDDMTWRPYPMETSQKLEASFNQRPTGSCLIKRDNLSFRILFREMEEKSLQDNTRRRVQRSNMHH